MKEPRASAPGGVEGTPPTCCDSVLLSTCCGPDVKATCCGPKAAPRNCGCGADQSARDVPTR
jgi:hypothetical protein